jgi:hypothetical protein
VPLRVAGCGSSTVMLLFEPLWLRSWSHLYFTASLARSMSHLSDQYITQALRAVLSLSETRKHGLAIGCAPTSKKSVLALSDSDHAVCLESHRSAARYVVSLLGSTAHCCSDRQSTTASAASDEAV